MLTLATEAVHGVGEAATVGADPSYSARSTRQDETKAGMEAQPGVRDKACVALDGVIGTAYLARSPASTGNITQPGGFPTNPRRFFNDSTVDVTTAAGLRSFQDRMLAQAAAIVTNTQAIGGQGVITWDIEGEQFPQSTSYVCSPDQIATVAPEMETVVSDATSAYFGQKLDDAYFKTISSAGLKIGLCLGRPRRRRNLPHGGWHEVGGSRVTGAPFLYALDTSALSNGPHTLQIWAHDTSNTTTISAPVIVNVQN